jgi:hypothetical protein
VPRASPQSSTTLAIDRLPVRGTFNIKWQWGAMTWIKTVPLSEANQDLLKALESQRALYPREYATPVFPTDDGTGSIVASHSLIPDALFHAFSTFGVLMQPSLPLERRQHEMIATMVSVTNRCFY